MRRGREWEWVKMVDVFPVDEEKGEAKVERFTISQHEADFSRLRGAINANPYEEVRPGEYVRLGVGGVLMMSDTRMEKRTNYGFVSNANGRVLVAGLGLGVALLPVLLKKSVTEVVVIEKSKDVIELVTPRLVAYLNSKRRSKAAAKLTDLNGRRGVVVEEDIFEFKVPKGVKFDTVFLDIWPTICQDNLPEIARLKNKFKNRINRENPNFFFKAWEEEELRYMRDRDRRTSFFY